MPNRSTLLKEQLSSSIGLPLSEVLSAQAIEQVCQKHQHQYRQTLFTPVVTLWMWLSQVLETDKSLRNAVARVMAWSASNGCAIPSTDTGGYCKARQRLPLSIIEHFRKQSGTHLDEQLKPEHLWCGRRVKICDGSSVTLSDTPANQQEYPQPSNQAPGCGFPMMKILVVFSLATGALLEVLTAPLNTMDVTLLRPLYAHLTPEDVVLADRAFGTYVDLALIVQHKADGVFRRHHARKSDFRRGKKLGIGDHIVTWKRPRKCAAGMSLEAFLSLPEQLTVREVHVLVQQPGFRSREIIIVTTLLDATCYSRAKLAQLYLLRWQVEVNLKHLKTTLGMKFLAVKTPQMARKELNIYLLAYNLLRTLMWQAGQAQQADPLRLSLQGTRQQFNHFIPQFAGAAKRQRQSLYQALLTVIASDPLPYRPNRVEPRAKKRRPNHYPLLQQPRSAFKAKFAA